MRGDPAPLQEQISGPNSMNSRQAFARAHEFLGCTTLPVSPATSLSSQHASHELAYSEQKNNSENRDGNLPLVADSLP
jgi:hypothetical protein